MIGSFLTRGLIMIFGYSYPAYECYKIVEKNKLDIAQLRFWCQYWILVALLTVFEKVGDTLISWVPMYAEAKLAFFIYLWSPKTKGATYVYDSFLRPYLLKHEKEIDSNLLELRTRAADITVLYSQRAATYAQTRVFEVLQYFASRPTQKPTTVQKQQKGAEVNQAPPKIQKQPSSTGTTQLQDKAIQEAVPPPPPPEPTPIEVTDSSDPPAPTKEVSTTLQELIEVEDKKPVSTLSSSKSEAETVLSEETSRITRGKLKKSRSK